MRAILLLTLTGFLCSNFSLAKSDTLEIQFAEGGKLVIVSKDKNQFKTISNYDINKILKDIVDTVENSNSEVTYLVVNNEEGSEYLLEEEREKVFDVDINFGRRNRDKDDDYDDYINYRGQDKKYDRDKKRRWRSRRTTSGLNFDLGLNNYLEDGQFPTGEPYEIKPWGSWFFAINHVWNSPITKTLSLEWGAGFNFYAFKLDNSDFQIIEGEDQVEFVELPEINTIKSKLGTSYFNITAVPVFDFGRNRRSKFSWRRSSGDGFRIGVGGYAGYRLGGRSKLVFREDGDRERSRIRDSFFLENWRYGVRGQIGYRDVDFFINYDFNDLFESGRGPQLNAISFGIII
ncbi:MAG: hypothetical protein AAF363_21925 [Bacteroidota bacterium]